MPLLTPSNAARSVSHVIQTRAITNSLRGRGRGRGRGRRTIACTARTPSSIHSRQTRQQPVPRQPIRYASMMDSIRNTIAENLGGPAAKLATHQFSLEHVPDQTGKVAVVTGGSEGIGYGATYTLLKKNISKLYILSDAKDVVDGAKAEIAKELGQDAADRTIWKQCDLANWSHVKQVAQEISQDTDRVDIVIGNAGRGIMTYQLTDYGVERHMAVNLIGHVVLVSHLLPLLKETAKAGTGPVRVTMQASNLHESAPAQTRFDSLQDLNQDLGPNPQYGRSKLAKILYARWFARNVTRAGHPNLLMNATHPGIVSTKMSTHDIHEPYPLAGYGMSVLAEPFKKDQFQGALSTLYAATVATESGLYICPPAVPEEGSKLSKDEKLADQLMKLTHDLVLDKAGDDMVMA